MPGNGFSIDITSDLDGLMTRLDRLQRENLPFVTAFALTKTAQEIKDVEVNVMARVFDRPTRFTLNALYVRSATKRNLTAAVMFKDGFGSIPAWRYLGPQVEGGPRAAKSFELALRRAGVMRNDEFAVPGVGVKLDSHGNISGGEISRMLSGLGASPDPMQNVTSRSRKRNPLRGNYFVLRDVAGVRNGIYQRIAGRSAVPIIVFVRQPRYRKRLPFYEIAKQTFQTAFRRHFAIGMATYGSSSRAV